MERLGSRRFIDLTVDVSYHPFPSEVCHKTYSGCFTHAGRCIFGHAGFREDTPSSRQFVNRDILFSLLGRTVNKGRRIGFGEVWGGFEGDREHHWAR